MADGRQEAGMNGRNLENDPPDSALDAALARYTAVEPRAGLEQRILANLRAERVVSRNRSWWQWSAVVALAAMVVVATVLAWKASRPVPTLVQHGPMPATRQPEAQVVSNAPQKMTFSSRRRPTPRTATNQPHPDQIAKALPKLDQFPSPLPLSEQEKILASYVAQYPDRAALIAEARMEALQQDAKERAALVNGEQN